MRPKSAFLSFIFLFPFICLGQGLLKTYDNLPPGIGESIEPIPNGYRIISDGFGIMVDQDGDFAQYNPLPVPPIVPRTELSDGNYLEYTSVTNIDSVYQADLKLTKKNPDGSIIWEQTYPEEVPQFPHSAIELYNGEILVIGIHQVFASGIQFSNHLFVRKIDAEGNSVSNQLYLQNASYHLSINEVFIFPDGTPLVYFKHPIVFTGGHNRCGLIKINTEGDAEWQEFFGTNNSQAGETLFDIRINETGEVSFLNKYTAISTTSTSYTLHKRLGDGTPIYDQYVGSSGVPMSTTSKFPQIQIPATDGQILLASLDAHFLPTTYRLQFELVGQDGTVVWEKFFPFNALLKDGFRHENGNFYMTGKDNQNGGHILFLSTDSIGCIFNGYVKGEIFEDIEENCTKDENEMPFIQNILLQLNSGNNSTYAQSDSTGKFSIPWLAGDSELNTSGLFPYFSFCQSSFSVNLSDSIPIDSICIAVQKTTDCPLLKTQVSLSNTRPCMNTSATVSIQNIGSVEAVGASVSISLPTGLEILSSSHPILSQNGNEIILETGNLAIGETSDINISLAVDCDVEVGSTLCISAHALPDTICLSTIEGTPYFAENCRIVTNSFDPNQKSAYPFGIGPDHWVNRDSSINYLIEFQNTGTDTAFRVVLRDTLSPFLDLATIRPGPASHTYSWEVLNNRTIKFIFDDILLPDSNINEALSHGFIQFEIRPKKEALPFSIIENSAAIYFDFNDPIFTNTVFHTIEKPVYLSESDTSICQGNEFLSTFIFNDTILFDTMGHVFFDSVLIYDISVLPDFSTSNDTAIQSGSIYLGIPVFSDTILIGNLIAENGCDSTVTTHVSVLTGTGEYFDDMPDARFSPNPTSRFLHIHFPPSVNLAEAKIQVFDLAGREVFTQNGVPGKIDLEGLPGGIYTLKIELNGSSSFFRVLKI